MRSYEEQPREADGPLVRTEVRRRARSRRSRRAAAQPAAAAGRTGGGQLGEGGRSNDEQRWLGERRGNRSRRVQAAFALQRTASGRGGGGGWMGGEHRASRCNADEGRALGGRGSASPRRAVLARRRVLQLSGQRYLGEQVSLARTSALRAHHALARCWPSAACRLGPSPPDSAPPPAARLQLLLRSRAHAAGGLPHGLHRQRHTRDGLPTPACHPSATHPPPVLQITHGAVLPSSPRALALSSASRSRQRQQPIATAHQPLPKRGSPTCVALYRQIAQ